jgi:tripartite-type tricarboxylate transporter receptor subunit TctC
MSKRKYMIIRRALLSAGVAMLVFAGTPAVAQNFPTKPVTLVLGFAPGGPSDVMARIFSRKMEEVLKQPVVIDNRPGAGGSVSGSFVARAAPDGYTILLGTGSLLAINVSLYKNLGYDPLKDFAPISMLGSQTNVLYVHPSVQAKTLADLVALTKAQPGKYNFASGGIGTPAHLAGELLKIQAKADITHVPFKGTGPALQNIIAGHVQMAFNPPPPLMPHIKSGAIRAVAVSTLKRSSALPDVPTIDESGYPGFEATTWHGIVAPAGTPRPVIDILHKAFTTALNDPDVKRQLTNLGVDVETSTPEAFGAYIKSEIPKWAEIIKASGAKVE